MKPFPGTDVWDKAIERSVVSNDMNWEKLTLFIEGVNDVNKPLMLDPGIDIKEFKKIHDQALMYSRKASIRRFIKTFIRYPIGTIKDIGNPFVFIKKNMLHANTLKILKQGKNISK